MKSGRRIKPVWGASDTIKGRWFLGLLGRYDRGDGRGEQALAISIRGALCWLSGAAVAAYLAGATALFLWFERRPDNLIRYSDTLLLTVRWSHVRELRGRMMITEGLADLKAQRWSEGVMKLRLGLARDPHHREARLALAGFYQLANRRPEALAVLTGDPDPSYPGKTFLGHLFALAAEGEDYEVIVQTCDRCLSDASADRSWLVTQKLQALLAARRADEALAAAELEGGAMSLPGREVQVLALLELGRSSEALVLLDRQEQSVDPATRAQLLRLRVRVLRELKRIDEMDAAWRELCAMAPTDPRTHVYGLVQVALAGDEPAAGRALDEFFLRFSAMGSNVLMAANGLAEAGSLSLVKRCQERAKQQGFAPRPFQLVLLQAQLAAGEWRGAAVTLADLKRLPDTDAASPAEAFGQAWLERLFAVATRSGESPQGGLLQLLRERPLPLHVFRQTADVLVRAERFARARAVLELAERTYPASHTLAAIRERVDDAMSAAAAPVKTTRTPPPSDQEFFEQLEIASREGRWSDAAQAIRAIRVAKPDWLGGREADVLARQMRVALHTRDTLELLGAAKRYLDGRHERAVAIVELARECGDAGDRATGALLLNEVLRKSAGFPPALRLKNAWEPASAESLEPDASPPGY